MSKVQSAIRRIESAIDAHGRAILQLSGGKDSVAVLSLCRPWAGAIRVMYGDTGDMYPHVTAYVHHLCMEWGFQLEVVSPDISVQEGKKYFGTPVDILPTWAHPGAARFLPKRRRPMFPMRSGVECCAMHLWEPLHGAVMAAEETLIFRGSKGTDEHTTAPDGTKFEGKEFVSPLWDWTDDDVYSYLADKGVNLPLQYQLGCNHSLDCIGCTAWGDTRAELDRVEFTRGVYPDEFRRWQSTMRAVKDETIRFLKMVEPFINSAED